MLQDLTQPCRSAFSRTNDLHPIHEEQRCCCTRKRHLSTQAAAVLLKAGEDENLHPLCSHPGRTNCPSSCLLFAFLPVLWPPGLWWPVFCLPCKLTSASFFCCCRSKRLGRRHVVGRPIGAEHPLPPDDVIDFNACNGQKVTFGRGKKKKKKQEQKQASFIIDSCTGWQESKGSR